MLPSALYPELRPFVPGCPEPVMTTAIKAAAVEFCSLVHVLHDTLAPVEMVADQREYTLTPTTANTQVIAVTELYSPRAKLNPTDETKLARWYPISNWRTEKGDPAWFIDETLQYNVIALVPVPIEATLGTFIGYAHVAPTEAASEFDNKLLRYKDALLAGAKALLYGHLGASYARPEKISEERAKFNYQVSRAKILNNQSGVYTDLVVEMVPLA